MDHLPLAEAKCPGVISGIREWYGPQSRWAHGDWWEALRPADFADFFGWFISFISGAPCFESCWSSQMHIQVDVDVCIADLTSVHFQWFRGSLEFEPISKKARTWFGVMSLFQVPMVQDARWQATQRLRLWGVCDGWGFEKYPSERWDVATNAERWFHMRFLFQHGNEWLKMTDWWFPISVSVLSKKW